MSKGLFTSLIFMGLAAVLNGAGIPVALTDIKGNGDLSETASLTSQLLQAELSNSSSVLLVDRKQLDTLISEQALGQQGMLSPETAQKLGKVLGVKYFCSGSLSKSGEKTLAIVKITDVETTLSKTAYVSLKSRSDAEEAASGLSSKIEKLILQMENKRKNLEVSKKDDIKQIPETWKKPVVMVLIPEMHVTQPQVIDPAGETEINKRLIEAGFKVLDYSYSKLAKEANPAMKDMLKDKEAIAKYAATQGADVLIYGEAISERGARLGEFEGCRARIELKAISVKDARIILTDSIEAGETDLSEAVAGKKAIKKAASKLADTFIYSLAEKWNAGVK